MRALMFGDSFVDRFSNFLVDTGRSVTLDLQYPLPVFFSCFRGATAAMLQHYVYLPHKYHADIVFLQCGTNDVCVGARPAQQVADGLLRLVDAILAHNPHVHVVVAHIMPRILSRISAHHKHPTPPNFNLIAGQVNDILKADVHARRAQGDLRVMMWRHEGMSFNADEFGQRISHDGVHPSEAGNIKIWQSLRKVLHMKYRELNPSPPQ